MDLNLNLSYSQAIYIYEISNIFLIFLKKFKHNDKTINFYVNKCTREKIFDMQKQSFVMSVIKLEGKKRKKKHKCNMNNNDILLKCIYLIEILL